MTDSDHVSRLVLDQLRSGALDDPVGVQAHLDACPRCRARFDDMERADAAFLERFPSQAALQRSRPAAAPRPLWRLWPAGLAAAALGAAALTLVLSPTLRPRRPGSDPGSSLERIKGSSRVEIVVSRAGSELRYQGQRLRGGDVLNFRYASTRPFLLLLSLESSGHARVLLPGDGRSSMPIQRGARLRLPQGIQLDDYPGPERLIALFSEVPLSAQPVLAEVRRRHAALRGGARAELFLGPLPFTADELSWLLVKERP